MNHFIIAASTKDFVDQAIQCALSIKDLSINSYVTLYSVEPVDHPAFDENVVLTYDSETNLWTRKLIKQLAIVQHMRRDVDKFVYLDADTTVHHDPTDIWDCDFDIGVATDNYREVKTSNPDFDNNYPNHNCGVIYLRNNSKTKEFFENWLKAYIEIGFTFDQITFNQLMFTTDLKYFNLPPEYNARLSDLALLSGRLRIIHRNFGFQGITNHQLEHFLNQTTKPRIWNPRSKTMEALTFNPSEMRYNNIIAKYDDEFKPLWVLFNWGKNHHKVNNMLGRIRYQKQQYMLVSSTDGPDKHLSDGHFIGKDAYFTEQWNHVLKVREWDNFSHIIHMQGDVEPFSIMPMYSRIKQAIRYNFGIYTPDINYSDKKHPNAVMLDNDYFVSDESDCTTWCINTKLLRHGVQEFPMKFPFGWGIDWYYTQLAKYYDMPIILDKKIQITHHHGRGYDTQSALYQYIEFQKHFIAQHGCSKGLRPVRHMSHSNIDVGENDEKFA